MTRRVVLIELPLYPNTVPLASGYLQAYAQEQPGVSDAWDFVIQAPVATTPLGDLVEGMLALGGDVYAMSCYLWNMRRMKALLDRLRERRPDAEFLLGGPQVMNHIEDYVPVGWDNVAVCNGEGEQTFAAYLGQMAGDRDLHQVPGLSFRSGTDLITTAKPARLKELDEIPSPYAAGVFDGVDYTFGVVETNRGCPFRCTYCYWGAATNDKVHRWESDRVKSDLAWISEHRVESIFIADANWGALPRDVELTRHIVAGKERHGYPLMVSMQAAKNRPDRVTEITEIFTAGGLLTSQPVSLQTLSPQTLEIVDRANIRESTYVALQSKLRDAGISSYTELIWPLPGETLRSYIDGIDRLCRSGADSIVSYPQLLLRNTPMHERRDVLGIETVRVEDDIAEADVVVGTKWVSAEDYRDGVWFYYAVVSLYNARAAFHLMAELDATGRCTYGDFLSSAAQYFRERTDNAVCRFFAESVTGHGNYDLNNIGTALHMVLHSHRGETDQLLADFLPTQSWWDEEALRPILELDLVARPYVYREPVVAPAVELATVSVTDVGKYHFDVQLPPVAARRLSASGSAPATDGLLRVDHAGRRKMPYPRRRSVEHNAAYCQAMMNRLRDIMPTWTAAPHPAVAA